MNKPVIKNGNSEQESILTMKKLISGAPDIALKASLELCVSVLRRNGYNLEEIEKFIKYLAGNTVRYYNCDR